MVYVGWRRDVEPSELSRLVAAQDTEALLGLLNRLTVEPGDAVLVPAGTAHAIGAGVFSLELQEPTDFSIMLELEGFAIDPAGAYLGLDRDLALSCVTRRALGDRDLAQVTVEAGSSRPGPAGVVGVEGTVEDILPEAAGPTSVLRG